MCDFDAESVEKTLREDYMHHQTIGDTLPPVSPNKMDGQVCIFEIYKDDMPGQIGTHPKEHLHTLQI